jgi:hypothetical protein
MCRSVPPKPAVILGLAALMVELPLFVAFLLVRWGGHFGQVWLYWPILDGLFPWFIVNGILRQIPIHLSINFWFGCGALTMGLIWLIFALSWRSSYWRRFLGAGLAVSTVLVFLAYLGLSA